MTTPLADALARKKSGRPQKSYLWRMTLPDITNTNHIPDSWNAVRRAKALFADHPLRDIDLDTRDLNHRVMSVNAPFLNVTVDQAKHQNTVWHYAARNEISELTIEIEDYEDALSFRYLDLWKQMVMNEDGTYNPPAFYKRNIDLYRMTSMKLDLLLHRYNGCFISAITDLASDYETSSILRYNVTFTVDSVSHTKIPIDDITTSAERSLLKKRLSFAGDDPVNLRNFLEGEVVDDAYNVFENVISRVPGF